MSGSLTNGHLLLPPGPGEHDYYPYLRVARSPEVDSSPQPDHQCAGAIVQASSCEEMGNLDPGMVARVQRIVPGFDWVANEWKGHGKRPSAAVLKAEVVRRSTGARPKNWTWRKCVEFLLKTPVPAEVLAGTACDEHDEHDAHDEH